VGRELYFSDFHNQRIRKLVLQSSGWYIYTVAGTGVRGDDPDCDIGCDALVGSLNYPRALAFSSNQDLYFVDSGNLKIRRLTTNVFPENSSGVLSTFIGSHGRKYADISPRNVEGLGAVFLPMSWQQPNEYVSLKMLYFLNIDRDDNLWYTDSDTNRLLMAPLRNLTIVTSESSLVNIFAEQYLQNFVSSSDQQSALRREILEGLLTWLPLELNGRFLPNITERMSPHIVGRSYWRYAQPEAGDWCASLKSGNREACAPAEAQLVRFQSIMGFCFDAGNNMYLADMKSSQLLYLSSKNSRLREEALQDDIGRSLTTKNCPCLQYWHDSERRVCKPEMGDCRHVCRENPNAGSLIARDDFGTLDSIDSVDDLPPCATTNYCTSTTPNSVASCFLDKLKACGEQPSWGFCGRAGLDISFDTVPDAALLGHALWNELRQEDLAGEAEIAQLRQEASQDLWRASSISGTSEIVIGFIYNQTGICTSTCCGLDSLELSLELQTGQVTEVACALRNLTDLDILQGSGLVSGTQKVSLVLQVPAHLHIGDEMTVDDCEDRCRLQEECTAFAIVYNSTTGTAASPSTCIFFTENYPYYVYQLDRSLLNETIVPDLTAEEFEGYRQHFGAAISPHSRIHDADLGIYVSDTSYHAHDMVAGPFPEAALLLKECQDLCISNSDCYAIAYPGCYLLSASASQRAGIAASSEGGANATIVFVKQYPDHSVTGVAGFPNVYASSTDGNAGDTNLNRPGQCVVDSSGSVQFADVWNQKIHRISGYDIDCIHAYASDATRTKYNAEIQLYEWSLANASQACTQDAQIETLYTYVQQSVLKDRTTTEFESRFCWYGNGPSDVASVTFYESYTSNVLVLCRACEHFDVRPTVCPMLSLCDCRDAMVDILKTEVYQKCSAPGSRQDPWHVWASSYLSCWLAPSNETEWLTDSAKNASLWQALQSFR